MYRYARARQRDIQISTGKDRASYRHFVEAIIGRRTDRQGKVRSRKKGERTGGKVPSRNYPASCNNPLPRDISMMKRVRWICWKVL